MTAPVVEVVYGTRPEAIKCAPLVAALRDRPGIRTRVTVTGQHRGVADEINAYFGIIPDADLDVLRTGSALAETSSAIFSALSARWMKDAPDVVVVQGDTASAALAAVAGYYAGARVVHLEAGLRSGDIHSPFPEEGNRRLIAPLASLHLAPTDAAAAHLRSENVPARDIVVTGNTGIDALHHQLRHPLPFSDARIEHLANGTTRLVLVTLHRRESWGGGLGRVVRGIADALADVPDVHAVLPVHPNPRVRTEVDAAVDGFERIVLCDPLPYAQFGRMLGRAYAVVTDSGGVQEEAPALGVPVIVARETTERAEGVAAGAALLVGTDRRRVGNELRRLLTDPEAHAAMSRARHLYGDGHAADRSADAIERLLLRERADPTAAGPHPAASATTPQVVAMTTGPQSVVPAVR